MLTQFKIQFKMFIYTYNQIALSLPSPPAYRDCVLKLVFARPLSTNII